jgi:hypothetical protein
MISFLDEYRKVSFMDSIVSLRERINLLFKPKKRYWILVLVIALIPALMTLFLVRFYLRASFANFVPSTWNDQTNYWLEAYTFSQVGFDGGYSGPNERIAPLEFFHFGSHGPAYAVLMGSIGKAIGWYFNTGIWINMGLLAFGVIMLVIITKPQPLQLIIIGLFILTFWSIPKYIPVIAQESLHQAAAMVIAAIFYSLLKKGDNLSPLFKGLALVFILLMSLFRFSWALLLIPFFSLITPKKLIYQGVALITSLILWILLMTLTWLVSAQGIHSIFKVITGFRTSLETGIGESLDLIDSNIRVFSSSSSYISIIEWWETIGLIIVLLIFFFFLIFRHKASSDRLFELGLNIYNLVVIVFTVFTLYHIENTDRVLGAHLLLSILLLIQFNWYHITTAVLLFQIAITPFFLLDYKHWNENFHNFSPARLEQQRVALEEVIPYKQDAPNSWCNTIFVPYTFFNFRVLNIPAGIGVTYQHPALPLKMPLKSQYVYLNKNTLKDLYPTGISRLEFMITTPYGTIYRNLDSVCPLQK